MQQEDPRQRFKRKGGCRDEVYKQDTEQEMLPYPSNIELTCLLTYLVASGGVLCQPLTSMTTNVYCYACPGFRWMFVLQWLA